MPTTSGFRQEHAKSNVIVPVYNILNENTVSGLANGRTVSPFFCAKKSSDPSIGIDKSIFDRKVSLVTRIKNKLSECYWWVKSKVLSKAQYTASVVDREFQYFVRGGSLDKKLNGNGRVKLFLASSDYLNEIETLSQSIRRLGQKEALYDENAFTLIFLSIQPDKSKTGGAITALETLRNILLKKDIELAETNGCELEGRLSDEHLEAFKLTALARCYQTHLLLGGLYGTLDLLREKLKGEPGGCDMDSRLGALQEAKSQLEKVQQLTRGLCHAIIKAQMPGFFNDGLYTPLKVTDKDGMVYFRSDLIQPRGGWKDTEDAVARANKVNN
ncbi:hypothetical protein [uncultured Endozoicomonas sp.]|uniref:hypothetical protein n=1 Tax=uncultured Endozoicomonas sp. TaxID=432652 RepID=UPI00260D5411|nr:hypothetical protein [uncultured Endozoicomonas sp.]